MSKKTEGEVGLINRRDALRGAAGAPEKWVDPNYSSLENYTRAQKPALPR